MIEKTKTAVFIGNRDCYQVKTEFIEQAVIQEIDNGIEMFLNGGQGYFDNICSSIVYKLKKKYPQIKNVLVIPYRDFKPRDVTLFDEIIFPFEKHIYSYYTYKGNIQKRNRIMVDWSSVAICCVNHFGGAAKTLEYAQKHNLRIIDVN